MLRIKTDTAQNLDQYYAELRPTLTRIEKNTAKN